MIRRMTVSLMAALLLASAVSAQGDSTLFKLLTKDRVTDCPTYILNAKRLIPGYYETGQLDSIDVVLNFLDSACGDCVVEFEPLKKLLRIDAGSFNDPLCDQSFINEILGQRYYNGYDLDYMFSGFYRSAVCEPGAEAYSGFVQSLARHLADVTDTLSLAHLYCCHLLGEDFQILEQLKQGDYDETCIGIAYRSRVVELEDQLRNGPMGHWALGSGVWSPQSAAGLLGNKMEITGRAGYRQRGFLIDLVGTLRFLDADAPYWVRADNAIRSTEYFFGGYFGLESGYECIRLNRFALDLHGGIGVDGFDCFGSDDNKPQKSINSANLNVGVTPRIFVNKYKTRYLGLQIKYNWLKYGTNGGSDLSGNAISVNLVYGDIGNSYAVNQLKELLYYE